MAQRHRPAALRLAGLWPPTDEWADCYTGVMVDATEELFDIHDRMPVIPRPEHHDMWLRAPTEEAMSVVAKCPAALLAVERTDELQCVARRRRRMHGSCLALET
ncbi:SOS response-associated peptidase family protein [Sphingopyxis sp.]|uniref:SOS response-associated peptidase family protein n=1 Tax=Sphingopyxis sp. TaxID=1908224 RepID=UPI003D810399